MAANQAITDQISKVSLERELAFKIRGFNSRIIRAFTSLYGISQTVLQANTFEAELTSILLRHYELTGKVFDDQISIVLPDDIRVTEEEKEVIAVALLSFYSTRAPEQSAIMTTTTQGDIDSSLGLAIEAESAVAVTEQRPIESITIATTAGILLSRKLGGRVTGISTLETQAIAEAAKGTEAQVLTGLPPSIIGGSARPANITKEWVTVGDERVREAHMTADSQEQDLNTPFTVGGQVLRWPGDTSLGATVNNVINCRCSSVINTEEIFAVRRKRGENPIPDPVVSEQLLTSLGA